ncbi:hypothetical protein WH91_15970 [Devosia psychrophila]|uniref:Uncharacterized protein n=1 Tax=Devosia psychrophila TaxID=728005 RepID=A0ABR5DVP1_9HYPH|nr:hypothetical protein WH91_15970 [Devosia psychrophila]
MGCTGRSAGGHSSGNLVCVLTIEWIGCALVQQPLDRRICVCWAGGVNCDRLSFFGAGDVAVSVGRMCFIHLHEHFGDLVTRSEALADRQKEQAI